MTSSDAGTDEFRVAVFSKLEHPEELAAVFLQELKLHPTDALIWARHVPGILKASFSAEQVEALTAAIAQIGIRSSAVRVDEIPDLHRATMVHHARCTQDGLQIIQIDGEPGLLVPWKAIQVVCVGEVPLDINRHYSSGNWIAVSAGHHYQSPVASVPGAPTLEAWIVCEPPLPAFCIDHSHMNYEYLGSRRVDSASCNFRCLVTDLTANAKSARLTESTSSYLSHSAPEAYRFPDREDLIRYVALETLSARETKSTPQTQPIESSSLGTP